MNAYLMGYMGKAASSRGASERKWWDIPGKAVDWGRNAAFERWGKPAIESLIKGPPQPTQPTQPTHLYKGNTQHSNFFNDLKSVSEGLNVTPRQVMTDSYMNPRAGQEVLKEDITPEVLAEGNLYRKNNPDRIWEQQLDDRTLDRPINVSYDGDMNSGGAYYPSRHIVKLFEPDSYALQHEVAAHATQHISPRGPHHYPPGLEPSLEDKSVYARSLAGETNVGVPWTTNTYQMKNIEVEARLRQVMEDARVERASRGERWQDLQDPAEARKLLESQMSGARYKPGIDYLPGTFQALSPEEQEIFLDHWSKQMPGLVRTQPFNPWGTAKDLPA